MKCIKVTYQKAFVIGPYLQEKLGVEIELQENESADEAFTEAKRVVETWHIANNPQVHSNGYPNLLNPDEHLPVITSSVDDIQIGITPDVITACNDLVTIDSYRLLIKGKQDLELAYMKRRKEIVDGEVKGILDRTENLTKNK